MTYMARQVLRRLKWLVKPDAWFLNPDVPMSRRASHANHLKLLAELANHEGMRVLEVGSREVTGRSRARDLFTKAEYVGFDYYSGSNVDVVGDAHQLNRYFKGEQFDLIYTSACFEHFAMPWVVATEMASLIKLGGHVFVETHFSYSAHERPWHFFQFSDMALRVLFSPALGIECIEAGVSNPMVGRFSSQADEYLRFQSVPGLYCHSEFLGRKVREVREFSWYDVDLDTLTGATAYPRPGPSKG
jgi:Methyltransferase domain